MPRPRSCHAGYSSSESPDPCRETSPAIALCNVNLITKAALVLLTLFLVLAVGCVPDTEGEARVLRVIDGDTIEIGAGIRVRYIGIDTPETYPQVEHFGLEASARNRELVEGKVVILEKDVTDKDRYGRLLRYVYVDGLFVNAELVRLGYARAISYPPDTRHQALFEQLEQEAQDAGRGMWGEEPVSTPMDIGGYRAIERRGCVASTLLLSRELVAVL